MTHARLLIALAALACAACSPVEPPAAPAAAPQAPAVQAPARAPAAPAPAAQADDEVPNCGDARAHALVKEAFIRRALVQGDEALIQRGALAPADAFTEAQIVSGMADMLTLARLEGVSESSFDAANQSRRCSARLAVDGWADLWPPVSYRIVAVSDAARFGVESSVQLLPGAEGFNMLIGYRSTFARFIQTR